MQKSPALKYKIFFSKIKQNQFIPRRNWEFSLDKTFEKFLYSPWFFLFVFCNLKAFISFFFDSNLMVFTLPQTISTCSRSAISTIFDMQSGVISSSESKRKCTFLQRCLFLHFLLPKVQNFFSFLKF